MAYRVPNTYARFVKTAGPVNNPGASRIMGLIGTGLNFYEVYNEPVQKSSTKIYDELNNTNVIEILKVSTKPEYFGKAAVDNTYYTEISGSEGQFTVKDNQIIWKKVAGSSSTVNPEAIPTNGSTEFLSKVTAIKNADEQLVQDGEWLVEITYVDKLAGAYRVINNVTKEIVGEYAVDPEANVEKPIPGVDLTVTTTFVADDNGESITQVGDYIIITTTAAKTEKEATAVFDTSSNEDLQAAIEDLTVIYTDRVVTDKYTITVTDITTGTFTIVSDNGTVNYTGFIGEEEEYLDIIPGITFSFNTLPAETVNGDKVIINTSARNPEDAPLEGSTYYVSYKFRKAEEDYEPKLFFDYDDIVAEYGNYDVTASGIVINSLALGAEIAFLNGATPIVCVQSKDGSDYEMKKALDKLMRSLPGVDNINTVIPLTESINVGGHAVKHVDIMSNPDNGKERMTYLGAKRRQPITKKKSLRDSSEGMVEVASSISNERVVFVAPGELVKEIKDLRTGIVNDRKIPACYAAVAVAALGLVNDPAEPLTNKTIAGFKGITEVFLESEKNKLAEAGCLVLEQRGPLIKVRHGITTSTVDVNSNEITLVQIKDYVIDACRKSTAELYIGNKNKPSILADVQYTITNILNQFISQEIILGFSNLVVKRNKDNPTQIDVRFEIEAVYPLNYIEITFGFSAIS